MSRRKNTWGARATLVRVVGVVSLLLSTVLVAPVAVQAQPAATPPAMAPAALSPYLGGTSSVSTPYGTLKSSLTQHSSGTQLVWPWADLVKPSSRPSITSMTMQVELCRFWSFSTYECRYIGSGYVQTWSVTTDYRYSCATVSRGGPYDSGSCDEAGNGYDVPWGYYYRTRVKLIVNNTYTYTAMSPILRAGY